MVVKCSETMCDVLSKPCVNLFGVIDDAGDVGKKLQLNPNNERNKLPVLVICHVLYMYNVISLCDMLK